MYEPFNFGYNHSCDGAKTATWAMFEIRSIYYTSFKIIY